MFFENALVIGGHHFHKLGQGFVPTVEDVCGDNRFGVVLVQFNEFSQFGNVVFLDNLFEFDHTQIAVLQEIILDGIGQVQHGQSLD